jgi:hypothetical protein
MKLMRLPVLVLMILALALLASGCMRDMAEMYELTMQPQPKTAPVEYRRPPAFACGTSVLPGRSGDNESCSVCRNLTAVTQGVAIVGSPTVVSPGASVAKCPSWLAPREQGR